MFNSLPKLPSRLQSSFGLLGDGAKLSFRTKPNGISRLSESSSISESDAYWTQLWTLFDTPSDVFSLITPLDIRSAITHNPRNIATLVRVVSDHLFAVVSDRSFPSVYPSAPVMSSFMGGGQGNSTKEVLNCLRVLTRVLPVVFELDIEDFERSILWRRDDTVSESTEASAADAQFVIADDDEYEEPRSPSAPVFDKPAAPISPTLAEKLLSCILDLLFCCGFTLPQTVQDQHIKINFTIWEKGVGSTASMGSSQQLDMNKVEVLRLLLVILSRSLYISPSSLLSKGSPFTAYLAQKMPRRNVLTLICSLLNTAMNSSNSSFVIPYKDLVWKTEDVRANLVSLSFQVLCALLDYQSDNARDRETNTEFAPTSRTNAFRYSIAKLHRPSDFEFLLNGLLGIIEQEISAISNVLPGSRKPVPYLLETVVLFWKLIDLNKKFCAFVLESERSADLIAYLCCIALDIKDKPQHNGLSRALSYILQTLSADPLLGGKMSNSFRTRVPAKWTVQGNLEDFIVNAVCSLVTSASGQLSFLYPSFVISLANLSPYFMSLNVNSSTRLVQLLQSSSNPAFLLSDESHPRLLYFILEVFNQVIIYHLSENPSVTSAMLRSHQVFEDLGTFTLPRALREIRRMNLQKERQNKAGGQKDSTTSPSQVDPGLEKAQMLENEGVDTTIRTLSQESLSISRTRSISNISEPSLPPLSPGDSQVPPDAGLDGAPSTLSEKAMGKRPERATEADTTMTESLERFAQAGIGRNGFIPTQEWVSSWQRGLPLDVVLLTIAELLPPVQNMQHATSYGSATQHVLNYLSTANLSGVLPPAPALKPRRFEWSDGSIVWLSSLIWGDIYVRGMTPYGIWTSTYVRLFHVKHTQTQSRQIAGAVSSVVEGIGGLLGRGEMQQGRGRAQ